MSSLLPPTTMGGGSVPPAPEPAPSAGASSQSGAPLRVVDWARRESGDVWLRPYRLTPERLVAYAAAVRAVVDGDPSVAADDPAAVLDPDRDARLRPWAYAAEFGLVEGAAVDPAGALAARVAERPALAAAVQSRMPLQEFAAAHLKLHAGAWALVRAFGTLAEVLTAEDVGRWAAAVGAGDAAAADFVASLETIVEARAHVSPAFLGLALA